MGVRNGTAKKGKKERAERGVDEMASSQDPVVSFNYFQLVRQNMFYLCYADDICARLN